MRRFIIASALLITTAIAAPAMAEETDMQVSAPSMSETDNAEPDWFRQFTLSSPSDNRPIWQDQPSKDVNLGWVKGDRWHLSVDLTSRPEDSPLPREEMSAEAEFRITPRISVGGSLSLGSNQLGDTSQWKEQQFEAGIRLRSAFKF